MPEPIPSPDPPDRWAGLRAPFAPKPDVPDKEEIAALRGAVDDAAGLLRTLTFTYLAVWAYVAIAAGSVTHRQLLVGADVQLPLLGTGVDLTTFFWLAPALFLVLHGNVLIQLYLLARRVRRFDEAARRLGNPEREAQARSLLTPFPFVEWRAGRQTALAMHAVFALVNWALYIVLPLFLLLFVQFRFLPYQHDVITWFHVALVAIDLVLIWLVWPRLNQAHGGWWPGIKELWRGPVSRPMLVLAPVFSLLYVLASVLLRFDQRPEGLAWLEAPLSHVPLPCWEWLFTRERLAELDREKQPPSLAALLEYRWSRLSVRNTILMRREPAPEIVAQFRREAGRGQEEEGERRAYLDEELAEPASFLDRNLRRARLTGSKFWRAHLGNADLQGADLLGAQLQGADLRGAQLQGAILLGTQLQGADLGSARLQGAILQGVQLQGAILQGAQLQGAILQGAQLQGADLWGAQLQGAILQGAQLQGANLRGAQLLLVGANAETDLSRADLREVEAAALSSEARTALKAAKAEIERAIADPRRRADVLARLKPLLREPPPEELELPWMPVKLPAELPAEKRRDVILSAGAPGPVHALVGKTALFSPDDDGRYGKALAEELARLACDLKDARVASSFVQRMRLDQGAYLSDLACRLIAGCSDLIAKLHAGTQQVLAEATATAANTGAAVDTPCAPPPAAR